MADLAGLIATGTPDALRRYFPEVSPDEIDELRRHASRAAAPRSVDDLPRGQQIAGRFDPDNDDYEEAL